MKYYPKALNRIIQSCSNFFKNRGYLKAAEYYAYIPKHHDEILKIREDECAVLFIKQETAGKILKEQSVRFVPDIRNYMLQLESYLRDNNHIDWYACLLGCNNREMYNEVIRNDATKKLRNGFDENDYKYLVEFVKDVILKHASLMRQIIVYDKDQDSFVGDLFLYTRTSNFFNVYARPNIKLSLQNHHVIVAFNAKD